MKKSQYNSRTGELTTFNEHRVATKHTSLLTNSQREVILKEKEVFNAWQEVQKANQLVSEVKQKLDAIKILQAESGLAEAEKKLEIKTKEFKQFCENGRSKPVSHGGRELLDETTPLTQTTNKQQLFDESSRHQKQPDLAKTKQSICRSFRSMGFSEAEAKVAAGLDEPELFGIPISKLKN